MRKRERRARDVMRTGLLALAACALLGAFVLEAYAVFIDHAEGGLPLPATFGNFERVRALLLDDGSSEPFSFAVVGDTRGKATFERICENLRRERLAFMVILGDLARDATPGEHRYLRAELADELTMSCPMFYVVGNHDVDPEEFPVDRFEKTYGPTNFAFSCHRCLFVVLRILDHPYSTTESIAFLEDVLSAKGRDHRKVFVFMHIPPPILFDVSARQFEHPEQLLDVFEKHSVDYVIAGDFHGYARTERKGTTYLVTGGGGAHLKPALFGRFHHALVLRVDGGSVSERIMQIEADEDLEDAMERFAIADLCPRLQRHPLLAGLLNLAGVAALLLVVWRLFRR